jgi:enamine deaminase RidA (YjgF/YER057c/UK114 family)
MKYYRFIKTIGGWDKFQQLLNVLNGIAKDKQVSIANVATRYILQQPAVGSVIIGARLGASNHIIENKKIFSFKLSENDLNIINNALTIFEPIPGDCGDEYRKPPFLTASGDLSHHIKDIPPPYKISKKGDTKKLLSGTDWEKIAGFSRAIMKNNRLYISGTTATQGKRVVGINDVIAQTHFIIDKIEGVLRSYGGTTHNIVRTRIFIKHIEDWESVARVHSERFGEIQPANTLVQADMVGDDYLVEIEVDAEL